MCQSCVWRFLIVDCFMFGSVKTDFSKYLARRMKNRRTWGAGVRSNDEGLKFFSF